MYVFERMVLDLHREAFVIGIEGWRLRNGPRAQHSVYLEAQIPVHAGRVVLVHDKHAWPLARRARAAGHWFRCGTALALCAVSIQTFVFGIAHDSPVQFNSCPLVPSVQPLFRSAWFLSRPSSTRRTRPRETSISTCFTRPMGLD